MKIWILHDTKFGNGKKLAELFAQNFSAGNEVNIGHVKEIDPTTIAQNPPGVLVLGGAIRIFRGAPASRKWLKSLDKALASSGKMIPFGTVFLTHGLPTDKIQGFASRYLKKMQKSAAITKTYPKCLTGRVQGQEGPFQEGVIDDAAKFIEDFKNWIRNQI